MKQHMLTHKIRDMPQHLFDSQRSRDRGESLLGGSMLLQQQQQQQQSHPSAPSHPHHHPRPPHHALLTQSAPTPLHMSLSLPPPPPSQMNCSNSNSSDGMMEEKGSTPTPDSHPSLRSPDLGLRRSPPEDDIPMAKRPSGEF
jgi:hypothetical protein